MRLHRTAPKLLVMFGLLCALAVATPAHAINTRTLVAPLGEAVGDLLGYSVSGAGDVNGDGYADVIVGAYGNDAGGNGAGRAYVYYGGPGADSVSDLTLTGEAAGDQFGFSVSGAGDVNGDGYADVIVGARGNDAGGSSAGRAYVYYGGPGADAVPDLTLTGETMGDSFGFSVSGAGDVNGDGYADVIVGAYGNDAGGNGAGRAYVYYGGPGVDAVPDLTFTGEAAIDQFGVSVSGAGDVNGDGYADVIVGANFNDAGGTDTGRAYVYYGGPGADAVPDLTLTGGAPGDVLGLGVSGAGDVNGDGYADVIVGAIGNDLGGSQAGAAFIYHGGPNADLVADVILMGESASDLFGISVSDAGDVNGDGYADVIVGAYNNGAGGNGAGRAYVFYRGPGADAVADLTFTGEGANDWFGYSVSGAGDVNGDGFADVIVGASQNSAGGNIAGRAYLYDQYRYILTSPNGGETWPVGSLQTISWLGRDLAGVWLSTDGGFTYEEIRNRVGGAADNAVMIRVPHVPTRFAMVRISPDSLRLGGSDHSDSLFTIETSVSLLTFTVAARPGGGANLTWVTNPTVGPQGISGYRVYRIAPGAPPGDLGRQIGPALITSNSYSDVSGSQGSTYRLTAVNGLGEELELGRQMLAPSAPLAAWPLPYRGGVLNVSFAAAGGVGGGGGHVDAGIYDTAGRRVRTLAKGIYPQGHHTVRWDGRDASGRPIMPGIYFLISRTGGETFRVKVVAME